MSLSSVDWADVFEGSAMPIRSINLLISSKSIILYPVHIGLWALGSPSVLQFIYECTKLFSSIAQDAQDRLKVSSANTDGRPST